MMTCGSVVLIGLGLSVTTAARAQPATTEPEADPDSSSATEAQAPASEGAPAEAASDPAAASGPAGASGPEAATAVATEEAASEPVPAEAPPAQDDTVVTTGGGLFEEGVADTGSSSSGDVGPLRFDLNGFVRGDAYVGKAIGSARGEIKAGYGELALQLRAKAGSHGDAYADARLRYGQQGDTRDLFLDLREAYADLYWGALDLRLGHQIIVWGRADGLNPTSNLTPVDWRVHSPNEDDRRLANFGARAFLNFSPVRLEGVWMPLYRPVELPPLEYPSFITLANPRYPAPELQNGEFAGKVDLQLSSFEMSASFTRGYAPMPGLVRSGYGPTNRPTEVFISRRAYKHHVVGFDFSTSVAEPLMLRGEAAYRHPAQRGGRRYIPRPDLQYVLGADRGFGPVHVILQYMGRYVFDWKREPGMPDTGMINTLYDADVFTAYLQEQVTPILEDELAQRNQILFSQTEGVQHLVSGRIEWLTLHETLSLQATGLYNFTTKEWLAYPKLAYHINDQVSTTVGGEIYAGPDDTLFGQIDESLTAGYAELKCSF
ncbi:MAG: hypothetical protein JW940_16380 [Polyangiaceae bacterium]|nr:hypothetical protein [Polyangiaceae bacterium]